MDRSNDGTSGGRQTHSAGAAQEGRRSFDPSSRLQKKRSVRATGNGLPRSSEGYSTARTSASGTATGNVGTVAKARKGSLRDAVRKIFSRQPREVQTPPQRQRASSPRHHSHHSEPGVVSPPPKMPDNRAPVAEALPDPLRSSPAMHFPRVSSPSTGAFPNSVKLKPLDLGNPQIRRRKTLPNVQLTELEAATIASSPLAAPPIPPTRLSRDMAALDSLINAKTIKQAKRRSRSAGDLRQSLETAMSTARNRKDEIKYWRDSFQPHPSRSSGHTMYTALSGATGTALRDTDNVPTTRNSNVFEAIGSTSRPGTANLRSSPPHRYGLATSEADVQSASGTGIDLSAELEDRVAKLEAGLHNFQRSLLRLTAERNRRTVIVGGESSPRSVRDTRTPSMLADTLHGPFQPSSYEFEYGFNTRQPTSSPPQPLRPPPLTPSRLDDPFGPESPRAAISPQHDETFPLPGSREGQQPPPIAGSSHSNNQPPEYTFRSLYQMLSDERSARRRLEMQLRGLRREITDLSSQMASSNVQSQRSSYIHMDSTAGSRRLAELLQETESSPPGTSEGRRAEQRASGLSADFAQPVVSRFSASESEAGAEDLATPVEAYQTPREARSMHNLGERGLARDGDMF